ncbi:hypothetical protein G4D82_13965 [Flavobacterium sp. CYK-4]|uniref:hypothetical protein n=1 Tax=Flavobacterium lotistagni TaxID=2709660 RepID=UPI001407FDB2|nr:hypothetical protein [Flavobacterium lotistagni]NHM08330.1 hypothetical protein [Flavobacterium lotistagni]
MKLNLITIFTLLLISTNSFCQEILDTDNSKNNNIYIESLKRFCDSLSGRKVKLYVDFNYQIMDYYWPKNVGETEIEYLDGKEEYKRAIKQNKNSITLVRILPLQYKREKFFVSIIPFLATYKKGKVRLANGGGYAYEFEFEPVKKGLLYKKTSSFGM